MYVFIYLVIFIIIYIYIFILIIMYIDILPAAPEKYHQLLHDRRIPWYQMYPNVSDACTTIPQYRNITSFTRERPFSPISAALNRCCMFGQTHWTPWQQNIYIYIFPKKHKMFVLNQHLTRWWFHFFFKIFIPTWGRFPF